MKYLEMEHERLEMMQSIKEAREKRSFTILQLLISLAAIVPRLIVIPTFTYHIYSVYAVNM